MTATAPAPIVPKVTLEKPALPTVWLDTSVGIKLTKIKRGEKLQDIEVQRGTRLQKLVYDLVRAGKLLCPNGDMEEEYVAERLDDDVHGTFVELSLGISFRHRQGIFDKHVFKAMQAYVKNSDAIYIPSSTYFHRDPIRQLEELQGQRFIVTVSPLKNPEILQNRARAKSAIARGWEQYRQEFVPKRRTYEQQLEVEHRGQWIGMAENVRKFETDLLAGRYDFEAFMAATGPLLYRTAWREMGGQPRGWQGLQIFFCSPHFSGLPMAFVSSSLIADLVTGNEPIKESDTMDVELLSVALPAAHYVVTDRRMELRIKRRGLDIRCGTEVYSMSTLDGLFTHLEKL
jgi:hypothetical protein